MAGSYAWTVRGQHRDRRESRAARTSHSERVAPLLRHYGSGQLRANDSGGGQHRSNDRENKPPVPVSGQHRHLGEQRRDGSEQHAPALSAAPTAGSTARQWVAPQPMEWDSGKLPRPAVD